MGCRARPARGGWHPDRGVRTGPVDLDPPPAIGPDRRLRQPPAEQAAPAGLVAAHGRAPGQRREYTVNRARDFYQEIAPSYDLRNSGNLVSTHLAIVDLLQAIRADRRSLAVLDLGGGTGKLIAIHFFNDPAISWTYVDFCPAMAALFEQNLAGTTLGWHTKVIVADLLSVPAQLQPGSYDVVLISLVLSSMPAYPDFAAIGRLLKPGGSLLVTDISPGYTRDNPCYEVSVDGTPVALKTTPVDPFEVIRQANNAGLRYTESKTLSGGSGYYSFITVFTLATTQPVPEHGDNTVLHA